MNDEPAFIGQQSMVAVSNIGVLEVCFHSSYTSKRLNVVENFRPLSWWSKPVRKN